MTARIALAALWAGGVWLAPQVMAADAMPAPTKPDSRVEVPLGTTAQDLAAEYLAPGVTLEQMLVALLQANPQAFAGGNINRLFAGARLVIPSAAQARQVNADQARQTLALQGREFSEPTPPPLAAAVTSAEPPALAASAPTASAAEASSISGPASEAATSPAASAAPTTPALAASTGASAPASAKTELLPQLVGHPAVLPATAALLALMAGLALLRSRQRKNSAAVSALTPSEAAVANGTPHPKLDPRLNAALLAGSTAAAPAAPVAAEPAKAAPTGFAHFDIDLSLGSEPVHPLPTPPHLPAAPTLLAAPLDAAPPKRVAPSAPEFDLSSLSLDLGEPPPPLPNAPAQKAPS